MGRMKQSARTNTAGREQLNHSASLWALNSLLTSQQQTGMTDSEGRELKTSYLNDQNVLGSFHFQRPVEVAPPVHNFEPYFNRFVDENGDHFLGMLPRSRLDGEGMKPQERPPLDLVVTLDVSGSMSQSFKTSSTLTFESKLQIAKNCLDGILEHLHEQDRLALVTFNNEAQVLKSFVPMSQQGKSEIRWVVGDLSAGGGTQMSKAVDLSGSMFDEDFQKQASDGKRLCRVLYFTDLATHGDQDTVVSQLGLHTTKHIYSSVFGIDVDLSVKIIHNISAIRGAKYISVTGVEEFLENTVTEFNHDVVPTAFDIQIQLDSVDFRKGYGSPEISGLRNGKKAVLMTEWASPLDVRTNNVRGAILLFKTSGPVTALTYSYLSMDGERHTIEVDDVTPVGPTSALRMAVALVRFVELQSSFAEDDRFKDHSQVSAETFEEYYEKFSLMRKWLVKELEECGDTTLQTTNRAYLDLIDRVITLAKQGATNPSSIPLNQTESCYNSTFPPSSRFIPLK
eukprot:Lithocolla_globosa_v1_NODE_2465_length_1991_cov_41.559401.p1 type:complete len:511 gc:universal NODE_2465_length_1991_cov_41.559401:450-1982(+)